MRPPDSESRTVSNMAKVLIQQGLDRLDQARQTQAGVGGSGPRKGVDSGHCPRALPHGCSSNRASDAGDDCAVLPKNVVFGLYRPKPWSGSRVERRPRKTAACSASVTEGGNPWCSAFDATRPGRRKQELAVCFRRCPESASGAPEAPGQLWLSWLIKGHFWPHPGHERNSSGPGPGWRGQGQRPPTCGAESGPALPGRRTGPGDCPSAAAPARVASRWFRCNSPGNTSRPV